MGMSISALTMATGVPPPPSSATSSPSSSPPAPSSSSLLVMEQSSPRLAYSASLKRPSVPCVFQMPLHYPRFSKTDYEAMPEWQLERLLEEYGLPVPDSLPDKRGLAIGSFIWRS